MRALTLRAQGLSPAEHAYHQLVLDPGDDKRHRIEKVADAARARWGPAILRPAALAPRPASPAPAPWAATRRNDRAS